MLLYAIALSVLAAQASGHTTSGADTSPKAKAQELLSEGTALYENGDVPAALRKFTAAYAVFPSPRLWLNIGQALRDLERPVEALRAFERFIAETTDAPPQALIEAQLVATELQGQLSGWILECHPQGAEVSVDGGKAEPAPRSGPIWMTPGRHVVKIERIGYASFIATIQASAGIVTKWPVTLIPVGAAVVPTDPMPEGMAPAGSGATQNDRPYRRWQFWAVMGGVVLVGGLALHFAR